MCGKVPYKQKRTAYVFVIRMGQCKVEFSLMDTIRTKSSVF